MKAWEKNIRRVTPYVPGEQPTRTDVIKLNTNENPYPPSPAVLAKKLDLAMLRKYPDPCSAKLVKAIANYHGLNEDMVFVGVGSDDVIAMSFMTFFNSDKPLFFPDITYSFYDVWAELFKIPYEVQSLDDDFNIRPDDYKKENGGVIFPNPNAPTTIYLPLDKVREILDNNKDVIVIVDEAYIDYADEDATALPLLKEYDNLLVVRTFSKSRSMAGERIGYACGNAELIKALNDVKYSFNSYTMNYPSIELGVESINDDAYFKEKITAVKNTRKWFCGELTRLGFTYPESFANFVFATHEKALAKDIFEAAKEKGIYVRYFSKPRIDKYLRITIGTDEEMKKLIEFLEEYLSKN